MTSIAPKDRYRRLDLLGRGGMGEVFLADDLLLRRKVAIKVVHKTALQNPRAEKLLRREAKAAAALDNPFICKVYEVGEDDGRVFIAMEYIQGETLRQRMQRGQVSIREVVGLAREIADGLDESSRQRVVHRDLKPSNIIITPQGHVKIMDFGLAKRLPGEESGEESTGTPEGMVVGTREYMSPEQLRGHPLEPNSDLFAFGMILYEMLVGQHPFKKGAAIDTQFAILNDAPPDLETARPDAPDELCALVRDLLAKSSADRARIGAVRQRLAAIPDSARSEPKERTLGSSSSVEAFVARKPRVFLAAGLTLLLLVVLLSVWVTVRPEATMPQARMSTLVTWPSNEEQASLSPDSKWVSFISNRDGITDLWLMDLSGGEPRRVTSAPGNLTAQAFSDDGAEIAYTLESETQKLLQTVRVDGGPPTRSLSLPESTRIKRMIRWIGSDVFMETQTVELVKVSITTGQLAVVPTLPKAPRRPTQYDVSRDGRKIAMSALNDDGSRSIWTHSPPGEPRPLTGKGANDSAPFFSKRDGNGRVFFASDRSGQDDLWFLDRSGREPRQITFGSNRELMERVSEDGAVIIFSEVLESGSIFIHDSRTGARAQLTAENTRDVMPTTSDDGVLAFARTPLAARRPTESSSIHVGRVKDGHLEASRLVSRDGFGALLSPDGRWLAFMSGGGGTRGPRMSLLEVASGHTKDLGEKPIKSLSYMDFPWSFTKKDYCWSPNGILFFSAGLEASGSTIMRVEPGREAEVLVQLQPGEVVKQFAASADGSRLYYVGTGRDEIGGTVFEAMAGHKTAVFNARRGAVTILGLVRDALLIGEQPTLDGPVQVKSVTFGRARELMQFEAVLNSWRLAPGLNAIAFARRDAREVENIFLKNLETLKETPLTANGIQGVAFSPVASLGPHSLVFSQQSRNRDLGIIRLDQR